MRLLIVEDEKKLADSVALGLRAERFAVDVAYDGEAGQQMANSFEYDLMILDLMLLRSTRGNIARNVNRTTPAGPIFVFDDGSTVG